MKHGNESIKTILHYVKNYKFNSVFIKNFKTIFLSFMFPILLITVFIYFNSESSVKTESRQSSLSELYRIRDTAEMLITAAKNTAIKTATQNDTQIFFYTGNFSNISSDTVSDIAAFQKNFTYINTYIDSCFIYSEENGYIISTEGAVPLDKFFDKSWLGLYKSAQLAETVVFPNKYMDIYPYYITVLFPNFNAANKKLGCCCVNINTEEFYNYIAGIHNSHNNELYIISNDKIMFANNSEYHSENAQKLECYDLLKNNDTFSDFIKYNKKSYLLTVLPSEKFEFKYVSLIPEEYFKMNTPSIWFTAFTALIITLFSCIILTLIITIKTYEPLKNIISIIDKPENYTEPKIGNTNEIQYIINNIISSVKKTNEMETLLEKRLILLNRAQTKALQAQINPHFLYNTLENLNMLAVDLLDNENPISEIVTSLSKLFRISADTKNFIIPLKDEIKYSKEYIKILKIRCVNDFTVIWDTDETLLDSLTVKLCLQPLFENAVNHGIKFLKEQGMIKISIKKSAGNIIISVSDNGKGMPVSERKRLNKEFSEQYIDEFKHIGLKNTNQRIKLIFGKNYGIYFDETQTQGTTVNIKIPNIKTLEY